MYSPAGQTLNNNSKASNKQIQTKTNTNRTKLTQIVRRRFAPRALHFVSEGTRLCNMYVYIYICIRVYTYIYIYT